MIPVMQTRLSLPDKDGKFSRPPGNCWAACLASILELPLIDIPDQADYWKPGMTSEEAHNVYYPVVQKFLRQLGYIIVAVEESKVLTDEDDFDIYSVLCGPSPRDVNFSHAVVARGVNIVHDPHPSQAGLVRMEEREWWFEFFVPIDVSKMQLIP